MMARALTNGERPLDWIGSSKKDFLGFPDPVKTEMGNALGVAQFGGTIMRRDLGNWAVEHAEAR